MKIAVTGGKGGTGKSTVATALAVQLAKRNRVLLFDADVDCPNDHIILSMKREKTKTVTQMIPEWNTEKCTKCGKCSEVCRANAIVRIKNKYPVFIPEQCNGCGACIIACPAGAIGKSSKDIGNIYTGRNAGLDMIGGELTPGQILSEFVVSAAKELVKERERDYDLTITDTAAGTHCDVISALLGNDLAVAVTEPTPLGAHDLELIMKLLRVLKIPAKIILNKSDIGNSSSIEEISRRYRAEIISRIPYSRSVLESYSRGIPVRGKEIERLAARIIKMSGGMT
jgi:MinD superfamily P-loop ATPase